MGEHLNQTEREGNGLIGTCAHRSYGHTSFATVLLDPNDVQNGGPCWNKSEPFLMKILSLKLVP
jgi:hypothetical protein